MTLPVSSKHASIWMCPKIKLAEKGLKTPCVGIWDSWLTQFEGNGAGHRICPLPFLCDAITKHSRMQKNKNNYAHFQFKLSKADVCQLGFQTLVFSLSLSFAFFASLDLAMSVRHWGGEKKERERLWNPRQQVGTIQTAGDISKLQVRKSHQAPRPYITLDPQKSSEFQKLPDLFKGNNE